MDTFPRFFLLCLSLGVAFGAFVTAAGLHLHGRRQIEGAWQKIARLFHLDLETTRGDTGCYLAGTASGYPLSVEEKVRTPGRLAVRIRCTLRVDDAPASLALLRRPGTDMASVSDPSPGLLTRDTTFDEHVQVFGDEVRLLAICDVEVREKLVSAVVELDASLRQRVLTWFVEPSQFSSDRFRTYLDRMIDVADRLALDDSKIASRLARNASIETNALTRGRQLQVLFEFAPRSEAARAQCLTIDEFSPDSILWLASRISSPDGAEVLREAVLHPERLRLSGQAHLYAMRAFVRAFRGPKIREVTLPILFGESEDLRHATIVGIGESRRSDYAEELARLPWERPLTRREQHAWVVAVRRTGNQAGEPFLWELMKDEAVRVEVLRTLSRVGGRASVPVLRKFLPKMTPGLKPMLESTLSDIKERLRRGAPDGSLSVVEAPEAGGLVLAPSAGALSLDAEVHGALHLLEES